jgi:hypothetical protein
MRTVAPEVLARPCRCCRRCSSMRERAGSCNGYSIPYDRRSRETLTLLAAILGSSVVFLDGTVVNVAPSAMREDLGAGLAEQQWVVEAYLLTLGTLILVGGSLGDILGRRVFV